MGKGKQVENVGYDFGTFKGVFMPSILTIFGVVMYLRFGWVLGNLGLPLTLLVVCLAMSITFLTGLSLSALATNMKVEGGGAYYMISRSLGLEPGAAVGLPLYCAQAFGISFYIVGFSSSVLTKLQQWEITKDYVHYLDGYILKPEAIIGLVTLFLITAVVYISANLAMYIQFPIFITIFASLAVFFMGDMPVSAPVVSEHAKVVPLGFFAVFAVFFPAVTGIEAGISMSGDLKDPKKSLPLGTLLAVGVSWIVYLLIPICLHMNNVPREELINNELIMVKIAGKWGWVVLLAIWGASLSSALGALMGAPRTLQALGKDKVVPDKVAKGYGKSNDPRLATIITLGLAVSAIVMGNLNLIAPILSMFFLTSYCVLNLSAAFEGMIGSATWRPTFRLHWSISLLGALLCLGVMIKINFFATLGAGVIVATVYYVMQRRTLKARWGDVRQGVMMLITRHLIHKMAKAKVDERSWRPNILVLSGAPKSRWYLIHLANVIARGKGFLTVASIVKKGLPFERIVELEKSIKDYLEKQNVDALVKMYRSDDTFQGAKELITTYGFGPILPNTIFMGESEVTENFEKYVDLIDRLHKANKTIVIVREGKANISGGDSFIKDIWFRGKSNNTGCILTIAFLLKRSKEWANSRIRLRMVVTSQEERDEKLKLLNGFIEGSRLEAEPNIVVKPAQKTFFETIRECSSDADLVFMGLRARGEEETLEEYSQYYAKMLKDTDGMPPLALVLASEEIDFQRIFK